MAKAQQLGGKTALDHAKVALEEQRMKEEADQAAIDQTIELLKALKQDKKEKVEG